MIRIDSGQGRPPAPFSGIQAADGEWRLDPSEYRAFTEAVTGIELTDDLGPAECYRIGNRLEAYIAERKREGEWTEALVETHPDVNSLDEITALARFLRVCHECCLDAT